MPISPEIGNYLSDGSEELVEGLAAKNDVCCVHMLPLKFAALGNCQLLPFAALYYLHVT